jgi:8-oxo-dGTP diphosphatase
MGKLRTKNVSNQRKELSQGNDPIGRSQPVTRHIPLNGGRASSNLRQGQRVKDTAESKVRYVVGFLFDAEHQNVVILRKANPAWQRGKWNGVGGKVEIDESFDDAMVREFEEETGLNVPIENWSHKFTLEFPNALMQVYHGVYNNIMDVQTMTKEPVIVISLTRLTEYPLLPNIMWLIYAGLDPHLTFPMYIEGKFG